MALKGLPETTVEANGHRPPLRLSSAPSADVPVRIEVVLPEELSDEDVAAWRSMQSASPALASPFLSPEFTQAIGRVRPRARVAVLRQGEETVAYFPFERGALGFGRSIGAGVSNCQGIIHRPGFAFKPVELLRECGLAVWEFDHLAPDQTAFAEYASRCEPSPFIDLSSGFASYLDSLNSQSRKTARALAAKERKLAREVGAVQIEFESDSDEALKLLIDWKSGQYRATGQRDAFTQGWRVDLLRDIAATRAPGFGGVLSVLWAGDEVVAVHLGLRSDSVMAGWFPAYDRRFAKYSPGMILALRMAEAAASHGITHLDMGKGQGEHKEHLKSAELVVREGRIRRRTPLGLVHHLRRAPLKRAEYFVLDHPALRARARRALRSAGALRVRWTR
jgi:CelD/BcsL family acetyltransferase involved in cellulose biosynthesis